MKNTQSNLSFDKTINKRIFYQLFLAFVVLLLAICQIKAQSDIPDVPCSKNTYNVSLKTQSEVDTFSCSFIEGGLFISGDDITDLTPLRVVQSVGQGVNITNTTRLVSLDGLENISAARYLLLSRNSNLKDISAVTKLGANDNALRGEIRINIQDNPLLKDCCELPNMGRRLLEDNAPNCNSDQAINYYCNPNNTIEELFLINAETDEVIQNIKNGDVIDYQAFTNTPLNIQAIPNESGDINAVLFRLKGAESFTELESQEPFALFGDEGFEDFKGEPLTPGAYTLEVTPYQEKPQVVTRNLSPVLDGIVGRSQNISFYLLDSPLSISSLELINEQDNSSIITLEDGAQIDMNSLPDTPINIRAITSPNSVGSVSFELDGPVTRSQSESLIPYELFGDAKDGKLPLGSYSLKVTPYSLAHLQGTQGETLEFSFEIVKVCEGNIILSSQAEVDAFDCNICKDDLTISGNDITDLSPLQSLQRVLGVLNIADNKRLKSLKGLENLEYFYRLFINDNPLLTDVNSLENASSDFVMSDTFNPPLQVAVSRNPLLEDCCIFRKFSRTSQFFANSSGCLSSEIIRFKCDTNNKVSNLQLINANTDEIISSLQDGDILSYEELADIPLNIQALTSGNINFVSFKLEGTQSLLNFESVRPFALFGDLGENDFKGQKLQPGFYRLIATPYREKPEIKFINGRYRYVGLKGNELEISFYLQDAIPEISSLRLKNTKTGESLQTLEDGSQINLAALEEISLNIQAITYPNIIGSVKFELSGPITHSQIESIPPYELFGDIIENQFIPGNYTLKVTPYALTDQQGTQGETIALSFVVINAKESFTDQSISVYPNPSSKLIHLESLQDNLTDGIVHLYNMEGQLVLEETFTKDLNQCD